MSAHTPSQLAGVLSDEQQQHDCDSARAAKEECPSSCPCDNHRFTDLHRKGAALVATTVLSSTDGRGTGLCVEHDIKKGMLIGVYTGKRLLSRPALVDLAPPSYVLRATDNHYIDARNQRNRMRFINHSCRPNCSFEAWTVGKKTCVGILAATALSGGTELTIYYGDVFFDGVLHKCACTTCRE
jgi:hypothetical protein